MRVLIAEDDAVSRMVLAATLKNAGHEVRETEDGQQAWDAFAAEHFSIVISDWMMPELEGPQLCRLIRAAHHTKYTYVILLTALGAMTNYLEGIESGADDFITKPYDPDLLRARLHVAERIVGLQKHVNRLEGLLPICSYCKQIRDQNNNWLPVETYIMQRSETRFSHTICPNCYKTKIKPDLEAMRATRSV